MIGYFVTGTDTGVGKTWVSCLLLRHARSLGLHTFGFKPVETGCPPAVQTAGPRATRALGEDQHALCEAAGGWQSGELAGVYRFARPAAPYVAARDEKVEIDLARIVELARSQSSVDLTLVEGAGGWRVPLTPTADMATLARALGFDVILAARAGLGTINHTLLSIEAIERDGCRVAAAVLSVRPDDDPLFAAENAAEIRRRWPGQVLLASTDGSALASLLPDRG